MTPPPSSPIDLEEPAVWAPTGCAQSLARRGLVRSGVHFRDFLRAVVAGVDCLVFIVSMMAGFSLRLESSLLDPIFGESAFRGRGWQGFIAYREHFWLGLVLFLGIGLSCRLYSRKNFLRPRLALGTLLKVCALWVSAHLLVSLFFRVEPNISRAYVILSGTIGFSSLLIWRLAFDSWLRRSGTLERVQERLLVVGWNEQMARLRARAEKGAFRDFAFRGIVTTADDDAAVPLPEGMVRAGTLTDIDRILESGNYDALMVADVQKRSADLPMLVKTCHREMVRFLAIPSFFEVMMAGLQLDHLRGAAVLSIGRLPLDSLRARFAKRTFDIVGGLAGLIFFGPVIALFGLLVRLESTGPIFYAQVRTGRQGTPFRIIKIRSMKVDAEEQNGAQWAVEDDPRRLRVGAFMRKWNIDELPQFWNVLKGDMSLVGPRPERPEFIARFKHDIDYYNLRHTVRPGVTGWAAVNGWRGNTDLGERIRHDLDYIERWSLLFDFYIMLRTFGRNKNAY